MDVGDLPRVAERSGVTLSDVDISDLIAKGAPIILRGAYADKALVKAGTQSADDAIDFIGEFAGGHDLTVFEADASCGGKFFYDKDETGLNFRSGKMPFEAFIEQIDKSNCAAAPSAVYAGSTDIQAFFPGLLEAEKLHLTESVFAEQPPLISIWIGNQTIAATHYDMSNNIAACMVGRRRFTLFPPDQIANLYPGPLHPTPAGQVVSMVDLKAPDLEKYPNFEKALAKAQCAELGPGDVLIYPAMWWHQVEALSSFNILINYWWNETPAYMDTPMNTLLHGFLSLRHRPEHERKAWRELFEYYVFQDPNTASEHLKPEARGLLGDLDLSSARSLRMMLLNKLNR